MNAVPLRPPDQVMRLERLGAFHQTRISFMRALLRHLRVADWRFDRPLWRIDARGTGVALYRAVSPQRVYTLVCFGHDLDPAHRTDRVIAEAWDATFALFDGEPSPADIERLSANVPKQEAGRYRASELVLLRANRSVRLFDQVVAALAAGRQPDAGEIAKVGYLMRTTAVYGNGKFGIADRDRISGRPEFAGPFRAEMLAVWLVRLFCTDLVQEMAHIKSPATAVALDRRLRRRLGIGNSTGLGLGPFVVNHPALFHRWILARETALARVRGLELSSAATQERFGQLLARARAAVSSWITADRRQAARIADLARDLQQLASTVDTGRLESPRPWDGLYRWAEQTLSLEGQELLVSLLLEIHGDLVDDLADSMAEDEEKCFAIDGRMTAGALLDLLRRNYAWALGTDYRQPGANARFWYTSIEKLEPRLGLRFEEPGGDLEQPLAVARDAAALATDLAQQDRDKTVAAFLLEHPDRRHTVRRVQMSAGHDYGEVRENLVGDGFVPVDLLRCKLAFFGAVRFDPKSDRWLRINMYQDAPYPDELGLADADDWLFPPCSAR
jgi:hypothetical protein